MVSEVERRGVQESKKYCLRQTTSHSSMMAARQGDASRNLNQAFVLVDSINFNYVDEGRSDFYSIDDFFSFDVAFFHNIK